MPTWTDTSCPHGYYVSPPVRQHETADPGTRFQVLNPQCRACNFEVTQRYLALLRKQNTALLQSHKSRLENINLFEYPNLDAVETLRNDVFKSLEEHTKGWVKKIRADHRAWNAQYGVGTDGGPDGKCIFKAELEYILAVEL